MTTRVGDLRRKAIRAWPPPDIDPGSGTYFHHGGYQVVAPVRPQGRQTGASPATVVRCMTRRWPSYPPSAKWTVQRLSHISSIPCRHLWR